MTKIKKIRDVAYLEALLCQYQEPVLWTISVILVVMSGWGLISNHTIEDQFILCSIFMIVVLLNIIQSNDAAIDYLLIICCDWSTL